MKQEIKDRTLETWYISREDKMGALMYAAALLLLSAFGLVIGVAGSYGFWFVFGASIFTGIAVVAVIACLVNIRHHNHIIKKLGGVTRVFAPKKDSPPGTPFSARPIFYCGAGEPDEALNRTLRSLKHKNWLVRLSSIT